MIKYCYIIPQRNMVCDVAETSPSLENSFLPDSLVPVPGSPVLPSIVKGAIADSRQVGLVHRR